MNGGWVQNAFIYLNLLKEHYFRLSGHSSQQAKDDSKENEKGKLSSEISE